MTYRSTQEQWLDEIRRNEARSYKPWEGGSQAPSRTSSRFGSYVIALAFTVLCVVPALIFSGVV